MLTPGTRLGRYEVMARLGGGGMGDVYRARDAQLGRDVAIKVIAPHAGVDAVALERFEREARLAAGLNHSAILAIYDAGTQDGAPFIVTELLEGETLRTRLDRGPLSVADGLDIAVEIAGGLAAAHAAGVVHRDVKPENLFLTGTGGRKILDFGIAKLLAPGAAAASGETTMQTTSAGVLLGTAAYMAPEQLAGRPLDGRADQFAFGVVLYEMFSGQSPFRRSTVHETLTAVAKEEPRPLVEVRGDLPPALRRLIARCVSKEPQERYASTRDLAIALEDVRADLAPVSRRDTRGRRGRRGSAAMLAAIAALATIAAVAWWRSSVGRSTGPATSAEHPTLAVLPFTTIGGGEQYFADGITEAVTTELGKLRGVRVIASNAAFAYRDTAASLEEVRQKLHARLVVSGSVQRAGDAVRISARLIDTTEQTTLWTEAYRRELRDILALQDEIARQIATTIARRFHAVQGGPSTASAAPALGLTRTTEAYYAYLRGLASLRVARSSPDAARRRAAATEELERAVALDPNFALARAVLASAYTQRFFYEAADAELEQKAFLEISKALAINPDQAEAYLARAQLIWNVRNGFPHERAVADLRRALAINPNLAEAHVELGKIYSHIGLTDKAVAANDEALRLDPSSGIAARRRLRALVDAGRAAAFADELSAAPPAGGDSTHVEALWMVGRPREAMQALGNPPALKTSPARVIADDAALRALFHAALGNVAEAERWIGVAKKHGTNPLGVSDLHHVDFHVGAALSVMGRRDEAVQWLSKAADEGYPSYPRFMNDPSLVQLKDHAAFRALLERLRQNHARWKETL